MRSPASRSLRVTAAALAIGGAMSFTAAGAVEAANPHVPGLEAQRVHAELSASQAAARGDRIAEEAANATVDGLKFGVEHAADEAALRVRTEELQAKLEALDDRDDDVLLERTDLRGELAELSDSLDERMAEFNTDENFRNFNDGWIRSHGGKNELPPGRHSKEFADYLHKLASEDVFEDPARRAIVAEATAAHEHSEAMTTASQRWAIGGVTLLTLALLAVGTRIAVERRADRLFGDLFEVGGESR